MSLKDSFRISLNLYRSRMTGDKGIKLPAIQEEDLHLVQELTKNGVAKIQGYFSREECAILRSFLDDSISRQPIEEYMRRNTEQPKFGWDNGEGYLTWTDKHGSDVRFIHAEKMHPLIKQFNNDPRLLAIGSHYLQKELEVRHSMANRVSYRPENLGSGGGWHRDMTYNRGFKAMVYLTDVDEHTGPFQYIPHSDSVSYHLRKSRHADQFQFTHEEVMNMVGHDSAAIVSAVAEAGTVLLFETNMVHRGKPIESGHVRYAVTNYHNF